MIIFLIIMICIVVVLSIHAYNDADVLIYGITEYFNPELEGLPTSIKNIQIVKELLESEIDPKKYTFIDFGSGTGEVIKYLSPEFKNLIGVELNKKLHKKAKNSICKKSNITVVNKDMQEFDFHNIPNKKQILYMYEPLWQIPIKKSKKIYSKVLKNFTDSSQKKYILYITGLYRADLGKDFFESFNMSLVKSIRLGFYPYRELFLYKTDF
jgi:hypothetical protein